tara:strand:- start:157 stop:711 length:555 start_codon:yes stop_codon:yes gene_type:complete
MGKSKVSVRGSRKSTFQKGVQVPLTSAEITKIAGILLESVKAEIRKDIAKSSGVRSAGQPVPIPDSKKFVDSFKVRITGKTIEIYSDWPTAEAHLNKKDKGPFPMRWLARPQVPYSRIETKDGISLVRSTPSSPNFWVHPGFKKYSFLERGVRKGQKIAREKVLTPKAVDFVMRKGIFNATSKR